MAQTAPIVDAQNPFQRTQTDYGEASNCLNDYRIGKKIGTGSFGKVKLAEHVNTGIKVAIKILNRAKVQRMDMEEKVRREIKILSLFHHPHIIRLYDKIETQEDIYLVMEYVKGGELFDYIVGKGRLNEAEARHFFQQLVSGVEYCHRNMVAHRDLKPENLLLDDRQTIKIADFGLSNVMTDGHFLRTSCGSPNYAGPEVISGKLYSGPEVDVWSCGVILFALLCGSLPFDDESIPNLFRKIKNGDYQIPNHLTGGSRDLITKMLVVDPLKRFTIAQIREHFWFKERLPRYLAVMQADSVSSITRLDGECVEQTVRLGFEKQQLISDISSRAKTPGSITYQLLVDNRKCVTQHQYMQMEMGPVPGESGGGGPFKGNQFKYFAQQAIKPAGVKNGNGEYGNGGQNRRWSLGIHVTIYPQAAFKELFRVMRLLSINWKLQGPYNVKCRAASVIKRPNTAPDEDQDADVDDDYMSRDDQQPADVSADDHEQDMLDHSTPRPEHTIGSQLIEKVVKFEVQLYKLEDNSFFMDFQRLEGDLYIFMDLCSQVLSRLKLS